MKKTKLFYLLLSALVFISCDSEDKNETLQLLPMPQNIEVDWSQMHRLKNGELNNNIISIKQVSSIPEAKINQDEA